MSFVWWCGWGGGGQARQDRIGDEEYFGITEEQVHAEDDLLLLSDKALVRRGAGPVACSRAADMRTTSCQPKGQFERIQYAMDILKRKESDYANTFIQYLKLLDERVGDGNPHTHLQ